MFGIGIESIKLYGLIALGFIASGYWLSLN